MKLTKLQRHTAYIIMLEEFRDHAEWSPTLFSNTGSWFCYLIWDLFAIEDSGFGVKNSWYSIRHNRKHFPELNRLFPEGKFISHEDYETREQILKQCIQETY